MVSTKECWFETLKSGDRKASQKNNVGLTSQNNVSQFVIDKSFETLISTYLRHITHLRSDFNIS